MHQSIHRAVTIATAWSLLCGQMFASSHSDAPLIKQDPQANLTDVYAFVGTGNTLNVVVSVHPFCEPGDGAIYDRFADDALYSINIANPVTGALMRTYNFRFSPVASDGGGYKNLSTILSYGRGTVVGPIQTIGDDAQNFTQTYSVSEVDATTSSNYDLAVGLIVPPPNTGNGVTPLYNNSKAVPISGAMNIPSLDPYTRQAVYSAPTGEKFFAGSRDDSFFADTPGIFDLLNARIVGPDGHGQTGSGVDGFKGYNVLTFAIQIPIANLPAPIQYNDAFTSVSHGLGVYASVSRQKITLRSATGDPVDSGPWIQVNRLGNPLFNEVLVAMRDKDNYNRDVPTNDAAKYSQYAMNPEIATLINAVFGTSIATTGRTDLVAVYSPDVLRVDLTTGQVPLIGQGGNRLSGLGGDTTNGKWSGWPNGRRLGDDVVDIALTAIASGPAYTSIFLLGDNINANDESYNFAFPYAATPHSGTTNRKDPGLVDGSALSVAGGGETAINRRDGAIR